MRQTTRRVVLALVAALAAGVAAQAQEPPAAPILTNHPSLKASLERIVRGSALFRADLEAVRRAGRRVYVLTPDWATFVDRSHPDRPAAFDRSMLAEVALFEDDADRVEAVVVVVNLDLLAEGHSRRAASNAQRNADLDRILVHEVYGHALPYLIAGDQTGRCADPADDERAADACSIRRENAMRRELGLGHRRDYGLTSLALARTH